MAIGRPCDGITVINVGGNNKGVSVNWWLRPHRLTPKNVVGG